MEDKNQQEKDCHQEQINGGGEQETPDFTGLITGLYTQTLMNMGLIEDPRAGKTNMDLKNAQFMIDTIAMLEDKTSSNLTDQETDYIKGVLSDLRMRYVEAARQKKKE